MIKRTDKALREERRIRGCCVRCERLVLPGYVVCKVHRDDRRKYEKKWHKNHQASGLCAVCKLIPKRPDKRHCQECFDKQRAEGKALKLRVLKAYGEVCQCCGEREEAFLTLDHGNDDGSVDRVLIGEGGNFYRKLERDGYPQDKQLRVLCFNCNCGRSINGGICPHKITS